MTVRERDREREITEIERESYERCITGRSNPVGVSRVNNVLVWHYESG